MPALMIPGGRDDLTAWSSDSGTAEQARNTIRKKIVRMVTID